MVPMNLPSTFMTDVTILLIWVAFVGLCAFLESRFSKWLDRGVRSKRWYRG